MRRDGVIWSGCVGVDGLGLGVSEYIWLEWDGVYLRGDSLGSAIDMIESRVGWSRVSAGEWSWV